MSLIAMVRDPNYVGGDPKCWVVADIGPVSDLQRELVRLSFELAFSTLTPLPVQVTFSDEEPS